MSGRRRQDQRAETRRALLSAAYGLFEERGYERTTMRAVAEAAGVGLGTIFNHFADKSALLVAAFEEDLGRALDETFAGLPRGSLRERYLHLARGLYAFYGARPRLSRVLVAHAALLEAQPALEAQARAFVGSLAELAREARREGELRQEVDAHQVGLALWADYFAVLVAGLRPPGLAVEAQEELLGQLFDLRLVGIGSR